MENTAHNLLDKIFTMIDFLNRIGYHRYNHLYSKTEVLVLKKYNTFSILISIFSAAVAVAAAIVAVVLFFEKKKKDEEELEHYLDCSIQ
jgi:hypothetical protein